MNDPHVDGGMKVVAMIVFGDLLVILVVLVLVVCCR
jgi:hypothetical protein